MFVIEGIIVCTYRWCNGVYAACNFIYGQCVVGNSICREKECVTVSTENVITLMEGVIAVIEGINRIHRASLYSEIFRERVILVLEGVRVLIEKVIVFIGVLLIIIEGVIILSMMNLYSYSVVNNRGCTCRYGGAVEHCSGSCSCVGPKL